MDKFSISLLKSNCLKKGVPFQENPDGTVLVNECPFGQFVNANMYLDSLKRTEIATDNPIHEYRLKYADNTIAQYKNINDGEQEIVGLLINGKEADEWVEDIILRHAENELLKEIYVHEQKKMREAS